MEDNRMAGLPSGTTLSTTFLSTPHSSSDGTRWFAYWVVPIYPFAPLQLQLQITQEAQELASARMMVSRWLSNHGGPLSGEEFWPLHIDIPNDHGDHDVQQLPGNRPRLLLMLADPCLEGLRAEIQQAFANNS